MIPVMGVLIIILAALLAFTMRKLLTRPQNTGYKERWESAIALLTEGGQLTPEQLATLRGDPGIPEVPDHAAAQRMLYAMPSWDRKALEVERARKGLPPLDDLKGMESWDVKSVMKARMENE